MERVRPIDCKERRVAVRGQPRVETSGRKKGSLNKTTRILKDAILLAAECVGEDGNGKLKLVGYLKSIARTYPKSFVMLLCKVLPYQITGKNDGPIPVFHLDVEMLRGLPQGKLDVLESIIGDLITQGTRDDEEEQASDEQLDEAEDAYAQTILH